MSVEDRVADAIAGEMGKAMGTSMKESMADGWWWGTFNAVVNDNGDVHAQGIAHKVHGFTPKSYKGLWK